MADGDRLGFPIGVPPLSLGISYRGRFFVEGSFSIVGGVWGRGVEMFSFMDITYSCIPYGEGSYRESSLSFQQDNQEKVFWS